MGIDLNGGFIKILEGKHSYKDFSECNFLMLGKLKVVGAAINIFSRFLMQDILDAKIM